jgi:hypothetical protein
MSAGNGFCLFAGEPYFFLGAEFRAPRFVNISIPKLFEWRVKRMFTRVSSATDAARLQTSTARNHQLIKRLSNRISHLKGEITKFRRALAMWLGRALEAERQLGEVGALPGFLREICRNTTIANDQKKTREWSESATASHLDYTRRRQRPIDS